MNKYQRLVVVAVMNALLFVLFPPFTSQPLAHGALPGFDGFYPLFTQLGRKPVFTTLLSLQLMFVGINTLAGWLVLQNRQAPGALPEFNFKRGLFCFALIDLALIFSFPPFEPYQTLLRSDAGGFDSFYFVFGRRSQPAIFWPLLYLECIFVLINTFALLLLFSVVKAGDDELRRALSERQGRTRPDAADDGADAIRRALAQESGAQTIPLGRAGDRRGGTDRRTDKPAR